jgi:putative membrane protein
MLVAALLSIHVVSLLAWIGSILSVAYVLQAGAGVAQLRGETALKLYKAVAVPGFVIAFLAGVAMLALNPAYYFKGTAFMHAKLTLALAVIGIHHVLGARAKKMAAAKVDTAGPAGTLGLVLFAASAGAAILVLTKPF